MDNKSNRMRSPESIVRCTTSLDALSQVLSKTMKGTLACACTKRGSDGFKNIVCSVVALINTNNDLISELKESGSGTTQTIKAIDAINVTLERIISETASICSVDEFLDDTSKL